MVRIVVIAAGAIIALAGLVYLIKLMILRFGGVRVLAEVVSAREIKPGYYVHKLRFEHNGKIVEKDDSTGYSQPFSVGEKLEIICSKSDSEKFEYVGALKKNMIIAAVMIIMAILIVLRFMFWVDDDDLM
ncbi:MAG: hypothetical protein IKK66_10625 [Ruminococcus sp.]|nr:hypothetical protein [Ruminococcus sp.]MBR6581739.1 hypothetical protein [Ruminococcus sp.]